MFQAPVCAPCAVDTYGETPGLETCAGCTADSSTDGAVGSTAITACLCDAGYTGDIVLPADTCDACLADTYKEELGTAACTGCTAGELLCARLGCCARILD